MERRFDVSPAELDAITAVVMMEMDGRTVTMPDGTRMYVERDLDPYREKKWLTVTKDNGHIGRVYVGIGR